MLDCNNYFCDILELCLCFIAKFVIVDGESNFLDRNPPKFNPKHKARIKCSSHPYLKDNTDCRARQHPDSCRKSAFFTQTPFPEISKNPGNSFHKSFHNSFQSICLRGFQKILELFKTLFLCTGRVIETN